MEEPVFPIISSFVIRLIQDKPAEGLENPIYRGSVRHVQTNEEIVFRRWEDAVAFMRQFTPFDITPDPVSGDGVPTMLEDDPNQRR